jgi:hypothetical protein
VGLIISSKVKMCSFYFYSGQNWKYLNLIFLRITIYFSVISFGNFVRKFDCWAVRKRGWIWKSWICSVRVQSRHGRSTTLAAKVNSNSIYLTSTHPTISRSIHLNFCPSIFYSVNVSVRLSVWICLPKKSCYSKFSIKLPIYLSFIFQKNTSCEFLPFLKNFTFLNILIN